jgi:cell division protein FtsW
MRRGKPDFWLILIAFILMGFGLVMVFSASYYKGLTDYGDSYYFFKRQLIWAAAGLFLFFVAANIPYTIYRRFVGTILLISILFLIAVLIPGVGVEVKGARRWIELGPMSFQPSELVKLSALIYTASIMTKKQPVMDSFKRAVLPPLIVLGLLCSLIVIEPHYSTTIIILSSCMVVIFCAGLRFRHFLFLLSTGIPVLMWVMIMEPYRIKRLTTLFNPWKNPTADGYQIIQSLYAIGPGGLSRRIVRLRIGQQHPKDGLPSGSPHRFHLRHRGGRAGLHRWNAADRPVYRADFTWDSHFSAGTRPVRHAARNRHYLAHRD